MKLHTIISICSTVVWTLVPVFYRKHRHFYFFFFLIMNDLVGRLLNAFIPVPKQMAWLTFNYFMLISFNKDHLNRYWKYYLFGIIPIIIVSYNISSSQQIQILFFIHIIIFLIFIKYFLSHFFSQNEIDLFYFMMIFYELITLFKFLAFLREITVGIEVFYVGNIIQIFIGILLIIMQLRLSYKEKLTA